MSPALPPGSVLLLNKPFRVLSQFSPHEGKATLASCVSLPGVYPVGRLDYDSEGLLVLAPPGPAHGAIAHPGRRVPKTYLAQVEGEPGPEALARLAAGVTLADGPTAPARVELAAAPPWLWERDPPIRYRAAIPTRWLALTLTEGRNRQVRRMTAAVGHPTLRLVRLAVGPWTVEGLAPGAWRVAPLPRELTPRPPRPRRPP